MADETVNVGLGMGEPENVPQLTLGAEQETGVPAIELGVEVPDTAYAKRAEAWAVGNVNGVPVPETDPTYHNNAKWYAINSAVEDAIDDTAGEGDTDKVWSADKTYTEISGLGEDIAEAVAEVEEKLTGKAPVIENTASGAIASFPDGADNLPVKTLTVGVEPVQDLHGYDSPWPAGGWKNLLEITAETQTVNGVTFTINKDSAGNVISVTANGTASANTYFRLKSYFNIPAGEYICNGCPSGGSNDTYWIAVYANGGVWKGNDTGTGRTFTVSDDYTAIYNDRVEIGIKSDTALSNVVFKPMIRLSSVSDATYSPYSNICPISGWTGANVWDDPAYGWTVAWNQIAQRGNIDASTTRNGLTFAYNSTSQKITVSGTQQDDTVNFTLTVNNITLIKDHVYYLPYTKPNGTSASYFINGYNANFSDHIFKCNYTNETNRHVCIRYPYSNIGQTVDNEVWDFNPQVFDLTQMFGSTVADAVYAMEQATAGSGAAWFRSLFPKDYYEYNAGEITTVGAVNGDPYRHIVVSFPSSAGTVYGGTLTVHQDGTGELVVDRASVTANSNITIYGPNGGWTNKKAYGWAIENAKMPSSVQTVPDFLKCSHGSKTTMDNLIWNTDMTFRVALNGSAAYMPIDVGTTGEAKQWLIDNNVQLVYELATPVTYQLTNLEVIATLKGSNNVWADTGDTTADYPADTKLYIDGKIAELQALILENINNA